MQINSREIDLFEIENSLLPDRMAYDLKANLSTEYQDKFQKTFKFDSKPLASQKNSYNYTKYSP